MKKEEDNTTQINADFLKEMVEYTVIYYACLKEPSPAMQKFMERVYELREELK